MRRTHVGAVPENFVAPVPLDDAQRRVAAMGVSALLTYPGVDFDERLDAVLDAAADLPSAVRAELACFVTTMRAQYPGVREAEKHYVETFDQRRRCSLFMSYYSVGDTRQRGAAILVFRERLKALGVEEVSEELPDHLCVLLEALARTEGQAHEGAVELLAAHREGLEVLRTALENLASPYVHLVRACCMLLPEVDEATVDRYVTLITSGPPAEMVGITQLPFPSAQPGVI